MGLIKAVSGAIGGAFGDQWLEAIEADNMTDRTIMAKGIAVRAGDRRSSNTRGTEGIISNGSMIHVYPNQMMMLVENGKIIDYTAEPGAYRVENSSSPSLFNGQFGDALKDTWDRFKYGGATPQKQEAVFINLQELRDIKFGTKNPIQYFDNFYNSELFVRCFGNYSIKVVDPILFYVEVADKSKQRQDVDELGEQFSSEFMTALSTSINKMSADGFRISHLTSRTQELADYMSDALDKTWEENRGFEVKAVGINGISYSEESQELINMRNQGAMLGDPTIREAYVQGSIARGMEAAGSNEGGAGQAFLGMGIGLNSAGGFSNSSSEFNKAQLEAQQIQQRTQNNSNTGNTQNGNQENSENTNDQGDSNFCPNCGNALPKPNPNFCPNCGGKLK